MAKAGELIFSVGVEGVAKVKNALTQVNASFKKLNNTISSNISVLKEFGNSVAGVGKKLTYFVSVPLAGLGAGAVASYASMEKLKASFETLLGSVEEGNKAFEKLISFTAKTPFTIDETSRSFRMLYNVLVSFGYGVEETLGLMHDLGNIAGATGTSLTDISYAVMQMLSKGTVQMEELNMLTERGIVSLNDFAKFLGVSTNELKKMISTGKVNASVLIKYLQSLSQEGGRFAGGIEKQSQTLAGVFSTLKDNIKLLFAEFGNMIVSTFNLKEVIATLTNIIGALIMWLKGLDDTTRKWIIGIGLAVTVLPVLLIILGKLITIGSSIIGVFGTLQSAFSVVAGAISGVSVASLALIGEFLLIGAVVAAVAYLVMKYWGKILNFISWVVSRIVEGIGTMLAGMQKVAEFLGFDDMADKLNKVKTLIYKISDGIREWGKSKKDLDLIATLKGKIAGFTERIKNGLSGIKNTGTDTFKKLTFGNSQFLKSLQKTNSELKKTKDTLEQIKKINIGFSAFSGSAPAQLPQPSLPGEAPSLKDAWKGLLKGIEGYTIGWIKYTWGTEVPKWVKNGIKSFSSVLGKVAKLIYKSFQFVWGAVTDIVDMRVVKEKINAGADGVVNAFNKLASGDWVGAIGELVKTFGNITKITDAFVSLINALFEALKPLQPLFNTLSEILAIVIDVFKNLFTTLLSLLKPIFQSLNSILGVMKPIIKIFGDMFVSVGRIVALLVNGLQPVFEAIRMILVSITPILQAIADILSVLAPLFQLIGLILGALAPVLRLIAWIIKNLLAPVFKILAYVIAAIVYGIVWIINAVIKAINWVLSKLGMDTISLIEAPALPALATGGLATGETLALVGERSTLSNPEVIAPLDKLQKYISFDNVSVSVNLDWILDGDRLRAVIRNAELRQMI